jgi:hypothetical protein
VAARAASATRVASAVVSDRAVTLAAAALGRRRLWQWHYKGGGGVSLGGGDGSGGSGGGGGDGGGSGDGGDDGAGGAGYGSAAAWLIF